MGRGLPALVGDELRLRAVLVGQADLDPGHQAVAVGVVGVRVRGHEGREVEAVAEVLVPEEPAVELGPKVIPDVPPEPEGIITPESEVISNVLPEPEPEHPAVIRTSAAVSIAVSFVVSFFIILTLSDKK